MRVLFCGGGTVGHLSPALAVADAISAKEMDSAVAFIGRDGGDENKVIERFGYKLYTIKVSGIERRLTLRNLKNITLALKSKNEAKKIIRDFKPDVVFGTGGYVCWPVIKAAIAENIPTLIHESNAKPGLATRLLSSKCDRVLLSLPGCEKELRRGANIRIVGNPVRDAFFKTDRKTARKRLRIKEDEFLIASIGGSGGSEKLNEAVITLMKNYSAKEKGVRHIHASGKKYFKAIKSREPDLCRGRDGCGIYEFINDMPTLLKAADVVISRCGAMTLAELSAVGAPSILIPSPNVTGDHQHKNARLIEESGGCILIPEYELSERTLLDAVRTLKGDEEKRKRLAEAIRKFSKRDSASLIIGEISSCIDAISANK